MLFIQKACASKKSGRGHGRASIQPIININARKKEFQS